MIFSEELKQLTENAQGFLKEHAGPKAFRAVRDGNVAEGFDLGLWRQMSELGWAGIAIPEALGGYDLGPGAVIGIAELLGAHLASTPFVGTVFAATALSEAASGDGSSPWANRLSALIDGSALFAVAIDERSRHTGLDGIETTAEAADGGYRVSGNKRNVLDVPATGSLLVVAKTGGGLTLLDVPKDAPGISVRSAVALDARRTSTVTFENVQVDASRVVGTAGQADALIGRALEMARLAVAAEMVGAAAAVFEMTVEYMRDRKQFGVPIGSFQALQHRAAHVHTELTIARAAVQKAAITMANSPEAAAVAVAVAKSKVGKVAILAANESIQLHGGVGVTDEFDVGLFVKRIRTLDNLFGDHSYHADRYARLSGF